MPTADQVREKLAALSADVASQTTVVDGVKVFLGNLSATIADLQAQLAAQTGIPQDILDTVDSIKVAVDENTASLTSDITTVPPLVTETPPV